MSTSGYCFMVVFPVKRWCVFTMGKLHQPTGWVVFDNPLLSIAMESNPKDNMNLGYYHGKLIARSNKISWSVDLTRPRYCYQSNKMILPWLPKYGDFDRFLMAKSPLFWVNSQMFQTVMPYITVKICQNKEMEKKEHEQCPHLLIVSQPYYIPVKFMCWLILKKKLQKQCPGIG